MKILTSVGGVLALLAVLLPVPSSAPAQEASPQVIVAGGPAAVGDAVVAQLEEIADGPVERVAGPDRYATAAAAVAASFAPGSPVFIASGEGYADALAGGSLAAVAGAPILLTRPTDLPDATVAALQRMTPSSITVLGGTAVVSAGVEEALAAFTDGPVQRLAGPNRYATAAQITAQFGVPVDTAFIASGETLADALSGGAVAGVQQAPVLLTRPGDLPDVTADALRRLTPGRIVVLGGPAAVSDAVLGALAELTEGDVLRLSGPDRFTTSAAVAQWAYPDGADVAYVASGESFADALSIAPLAAGAATGTAFALAGAPPAGPVLLTARDRLPDGVTAALRRLLGGGGGPTPPGNGAPTVEDRSATTVAGEPVNILLIAEDPDGDDVTFTISDPPDRGSATVAGDIATYVPEDADEGYTTSFGYTASDGEDTSEEGRVTITVTAPPVPDNERPRVLLDAPGPGFATTATEDAGPALLVDPASATVTDADGTVLRSLTATLDPVPDAPAEVLAADVAGTDLAAGFDAATGVLTLTPIAPATTAPLADFEAALRTLTYATGDQDPTEGDRSATVVAVDGAGAASAPVVATVQVVAVNDAPTLALPGPLAVEEDAVLTLSGPAAVQVADVDAGAEELAVELGTADAMLDLAGVAGLTFTSGDGVGDAAMAFTGTLTAINAALDGLTLTPAPGYEGAVALTVAVDDQGHRGGGGPLTDTGTVTVTVGPVNDAPVVTVPAAQDVDEDQDLVLGGASAISVADVDAGTADVATTLTATSGTVALAQAIGLVVTGDGTSLVTVEGPITATNAALDGLTFAPSADATGPATIDVVVDDLGNTGAGGPLTGSGSVAIQITPVNDAPTISAIANTTSDEDAVAGPIGVTVADVDDAAADLVMTATSSDQTLVPDSGIVVGGVEGARTVTITPAADRFGTATITVTVSDGEASAAESFVLTVVSVNDAPVHTVPAGPITVPEDDQLVLGGARAIAVSDVDAGGDDLQTTLTAANGLITLTGTTGLTFVSGSGANDATMTFRGSQTDIRIAMDGMVFAPTPGYDGPASLRIVTSDQGSTGAGGAQTDDDTLAITVTPVNDVPTISAIADQVIAEDGTTGALPFTVDDVETAAGDLEVTAQSSNLVLVPASGIVLGGSGAARTITVTPSAGLSGSADITVTVDDGTDSAAEVFTVTVAAVNDPPVLTLPVAQTIDEDTDLTLSSGGGNAVSIGDVDAGSGELAVGMTIGNATISLSDTTGLTFSSGDGTADPSMVFTGTLAAINTALDGMTVTPAPDANGSLSLDVVVDDQGNTGGAAETDLGSLPITVTAVNDLPTITAIADVTIDEDTATSAIPFTIGDVETDVTALTVTAASSDQAVVADAGIALAGTDQDRTVTVTPLAGASGSADITVTVTDADTGSVVETFTVTVTAVNDAPVVTMPAAQTTDVDTPLVLGGATAITVADDDAGTAPVLVDLTATDGVVDLATTAGLAFTTGTGTAEDAMTFSGTLAAVNAALDGLTFTPTTGFVGDATLTLAVDDQGATGTGGPLADTEVLTITVAPPNDPPTISPIADVTTDEDTATAAIPFTVGDTETDPAALVVTASSSDQTVVADADIALGGAGANRTVTLTPVPDAVGSAVVTVTVDDGAASTDEALTVTVTAVNDAPVLTVPAAQSVDEDAVLVLTGATAISAADIDAGGAAVAVDLTATDGTLTLGSLDGLAFATGDGTDDADMAFTGTLAAVNTALDGLSFTPTADFVGAASITATVDDQGSTGSGGALSDTEVLAVTVDPVNDPPSFTGGGDVDVDEDAGAQTITGWAGAVSAGPADEAGQSLTFDVALDPADDASLFAVPPAISAAGDLTFTPAANRHGAVTVTVTLADDGGGDDTSAPQTFTLTIDAINDPPTSADPAYDVQANMLRTIDAAEGLLADADDAADVIGDPAYTPVLTVGEVGGAGPVAGTITAVVAGVGTVVADAATGAFTFDPAPGVAGAVSFDYTICDSGDGDPPAACTTVTADVTLEGPVVWFVDDSAAADGVGTLTSPFDTLGEAVTAVGTAEEHRIFLYDGSYSGSVPLRTGGQLIAQSTTGGTFDAIVLGGAPPAGTAARPALATAGPSTVAGTVTLATNGVVSHVAISSGASPALIGGSAGVGGALTGVSVTQTSLTTTTGQPLFLDEVAGTLTFGAVSKTGASGSGVQISSSPSATVTFANGFAVQSAGTPALSVLGGATVAVPQGAGVVNTLTTTSAPALRVENSTIGAADLVFRSITATGGTTGIQLTSTGTAGGLVVTGNSAGVCGGSVSNTSGSYPAPVAADVADCSGGTISGMTGDGIRLTSTRDVSLTRMSISGNGGSGIWADEVTGLVISDSRIVSNADAIDGSEAGIRALDLLGTANALTRTTVSGSSEDNIRITPSTGAGAVLTVSGSTLGPNNATTGGHGLSIIATGGSGLSLQMSSTSIPGVRSSGVLVNGTDTTALIASVTTTDFSDVGAGVTLQTSSSADLTFTVSGSRVVRAVGNAIQLIAGSSSTTSSDVRGTIATNVVGGAGVDSGSRDQYGIAIDLRGDQSSVIDVIGNTVSNVDVQGFWYSAAEFAASAASPQSDLTFRSNTINVPDDNSAFPFGFQYGSLIDVRHTTQACVDTAGNSSTGLGGAEGLRLRQRDTSGLRLERLPGTTSDPGVVASFLAGQNPGTTANAAIATTITAAADGACRTP